MLNAVIERSGDVARTPALLTGDAKMLCGFGDSVAENCYY
jgi:hypothetical protein